jgi:hypothetical protein
VNDAVQHDASREGFQPESPDSVNIGRELLEEAVVRLNMSDYPSDWALATKLAIVLWPRLSANCDE